MPYTATQLNAYYTSLTGTAPMGADAVLISAYATQSGNGTLSDTNTLLGVFNSAGVQATFEVAESTYQFFTGSGVSQAGLNFLEGNAGSGNANGLNTAYYTQFNTENRYYNFAINLATTGGAGNAGFISTYGALSFAQTVSAAYETIVGSANVGTAAANAAIADITSRQAFFTAVAQQRAGGVDIGGTAGQNIALKAIVVGYILEEANKADVGTYAKAIDQLEASVSATGSGAQITSPFGVNILSTFSNGGTGFNTGFAALGVTGATQTNFSLTTGVDTFQPTVGGLQFVGVVNNTAAGVGGATGNPTTLQAGDQVIGTGANNTLTVDTLGGGDATGAALISGIQTINVRDADGNTSSIAATSVPGATLINQYLGSGGVTVTGLSTSTAVGIVGNGTAPGGTLNAAFTGAGTASVNIASGTVASDNVTLTGPITSVNLNSNGALNRLGTVTLPTSVTTLNLASTSSLTVNTTTATGLTTLTASGNGAVNLGTTTDIGGGAASTGTVTSVNTTGLTTTGALTARFFTSAAAETFTLGAGSDVLVLDGNLATGTVINTGAGSNSITVNGALIGTASIIGGAGADTVTVTGALAATSVINTAGGGDTVNIDTAIGGPATTVGGATINGGGGATLVTNEFNLFGIDQFSAAQRALITGFTTVAVDDQLATFTYDINAIGAQNFSTVGVARGSTATLAANTGALVTFTGNIGGFGGGDLSTNTGTLVVSEASVSQGATNNTLTLGYQAQPAGTITSTVQTPGVQTVNIVTSGTTTNATNIQLALADTALTTLNISGNESLTYVAPAASTLLKTINGSTATGTIVVDATALTSTLNSPVTITTGSGNDIVSVRDFDRVTTGASSGAGNFNTINVAVTTSGQTYSSVLDAKATDHITFAGQTSTNATKIVLNSTAVFQDYLDAASGTGLAVGAVSAFDFSGNTYLVENNNAAITYQNGVDSVIQLVGIHTIAASTTSVILGS